MEGGASAAESMETTPPPKLLSRISVAIAHRVAWLVAAIVFAGLVLRPGFGDELFVTRYTGYVMPWLLVGLLPGAALAWHARRWALATVLGVSATVVVVIHAPLFRPRPASARPAAATLKVMSYNTWSRNADEDRIANVVLGHQPDILLLQEIQAELFSRLMNRLRDLYGGSPVHRVHEPEVQQAVVSRYPVESLVTMKEKGQAQKVVLRLPSGPIAVFNVHPLRSGGWKHRYRQIASLLEEEVVRERMPVILGGDFNAPDHSQLYELVAGHLRNAHREAGSGFGFTYPSSDVRVLRLFPAPSVVRIDHIFFSGHFVALRAGTMKESGGSDHRAVFAELDLQTSTTDDARVESPAHPTGK